MNDVQRDQPSVRAPVKPSSKPRRMAQESQDQSTIKSCAACRTCATASGGVFPNCKCMFTNGLCLYLLPAANARSDLQKHYDIARTLHTHAQGTGESVSVAPSCIRWLSVSGNTGIQCRPYSIQLQRYTVWPRSIRSNFDRASHLALSLRYSLTPLAIGLTHRLSLHSLMEHISIALTRQAPP